MMEQTIAENRNGQPPLHELEVDEIDRLLEEDMDDDRILEQYRQKRLAEMRETKSAGHHRFGEIREISKPDFVREVTEASQKCWVVVFLYKSGLPECQIMEALLRQLASSHPLTKFLSIIGDRCIEGYPDRNLPTLLIYGKGDLQKQLVGTSQFGGMAGMSRQRLEKFLSDCGAIELSTNRQRNTNHDTASSSSDEDEY